ncbi:N-acetyl-gamma-glutamyl-phosphate reductase [Marinicellulosiphila megalodicopiae]|uniref:N-acetyl-gamma-glutamyl-phosphate reductase n=1 Tax=Marinicellulosiphila megalodicopiae TaxID=2724896 RepID=UPI003BB16B68
MKVGVVGGTGYTGVELLRLLAMHENVEVVAVTSRGESGNLVSSLFPSLRGFLDIAFCDPESVDLSICDVVFYATPNGIAMQQVPELLAKGVRVIDLAADFRIKDIPTWEKWYGMTHACPDAVAKAVYGLCEINRDEIKDAQLIANPGCYPTSVQLPLIPLLEKGLVSKDNIIADCKSGVSGAGRGAAVSSLMSEVNESFKAYGVSGHRHLPEIEQGLSFAAKQEVQMTFTPHLVPMNRGILSTIYVDLIDTDVNAVQAYLEEFYKDDAFVDVLPIGSLPETRSVKGANICRFSLHQPQGRNKLVIVSVIDNLVKGAAGQAVQNMNIMFGFKETAYINFVPLLP